jgi:hypothetical protein
MKFLAIYYYSPPRSPPGEYSTKPFLRSSPPLSAASYGVSQTPLPSQYVDPPSCARSADATSLNSRLESTHNSFSAALGTLRPCCRHPIWTLCCVVAQTRPTCHRASMSCDTECSSMASPPTATQPQVRLAESIQSSLKSVNDIIVSPFLFLCLLAPN